MKEEVEEKITTIRNYEIMFFICLSAGLYIQQTQGRIQDIK
eukprot:gene1483-872_t